MCSNHGFVNVQNKLVKLYQVYYYISGSPCAHVYKNNRNMNKALGGAYVDFLRNLSVFPNKDKMKLLKIIQSQPSVLLEIPKALFKKIIAEMHSREDN